MIEWYVGFYAPSFRNHLGQVSPMAWFGHVELWGYTADDTWMFFDPQGTGTRILITHHHDDVIDQLTARHTLCDTIFRLTPRDHALFPIFPPMTCATIIGHILGLRAFTPKGLKRKLAAIGAEVIHEVTTRGSGRQGGEAAGTPPL